MNTFCNKLKLIIAILFSAYGITASGQCSVELGNNQTICANQSVVLMPALTGTSGTVTYQWSPQTYLNTTQNGATNAQPIATPQQTTTYNVTITDGTGCTATDALTLTTSGAGPIVNATVSPSVVCAGTQVNLNFTSEPRNCGLNYAGCTGLSRSDSVGLGGTVQPPVITNATVYGNFYRSTRMQILYTGAELNALFGSAGTFRSVGWRVGTFNSGATLQNFTIKMACVPTTTTQLTTWLTGLGQVYAQATYIPTPGWNMHNLQTLFDWDGVSNVVVEICYFNPSTSNNQINQMRYDNIPNSVLYSIGNTDQCSVNNAPTQSAVRPMMRVFFCQPDYNNFTVNWTPATGANAVDSSNVRRNTTAHPQTTQTYMVAVTQAGGCAGTNYVTVTVDTTVKVNGGPDRNFCLGQSVPLSALSSGVPLAPATQFNYQWRQLPSNTPVGVNQANITVTPSATTTYYVTMIGGPCPVYDTITLTVGSLPITLTPTNITCNGANNGSILATPNGAAPYTYTWSANAATGNVNQANNLAAATYTVTVSDNNTCTGSATATITQPATLALTAPAILNTKCNGSSDGRIATGATGGTGAYTFTWSNSIPSNDTAYNLAAGTYTVTVRDANSCSATAPYTVTQPTAVDTSSVTTRSVRCFNGTDGQITVNPTGGTGPYHYIWSHSATLTTNVATNLQAGTYTVTVLDANNCSRIVTGIQITQPATGLTLPTPTFVPVTCNGGNNGTATAHPQGGAGGYDYRWNNNQTTQTATNLIAGTYTVTVEDDSLCTAIASVTVSQQPAIGITGVVTNVSCSGGTNGAVDITITNGVGSFIYTWSNTASTQDITGVAANTYAVTVRDQTLCTASASFTVTQPTALTLGPATITNVSCFGGNNGSITANPSGGTGTYTYNWAPSGGSGQTASGLAQGTYTLTLTDANNCTATAQYTVTQPATAVAFGAATVTNVLCNAAATGSIATTVTGGTTPYTYSWNHNTGLNNATATGLTANSYTVSVSDANGCSATQANTITQPSAITFTAQPSVTNVSCNGNTDGSAEVFPTGGTAPYTYTWNGNAGTNPQGNLAANTYTVVVTDNNACTASAQLVISEPTAIVIDTNVTDVRCFNGTDGSIALVVTGGTPGFTYLWSNTQTTATVTGLSMGTYSVTVTDSRSCTASISAAVGQPNSLTVNATPTPVSCAGDIDGRINATAIGGTQPWHYILNFGGTDIADNYTGAFNGLNSGDYIIRVEDFNNCSATTNVTIGSPVADVYSISAQPTSCYGDGFTDGIIYVYGLTPINQPYQFQLDGGASQFSNDFYNVSAGQHTVTATNYFGCVTNLPITVTAPAEGIAEIIPADTIVQVGETIQLFSLLSPYADTTINGYSWGPVLGLSCTDCPNPFLTSYARQQEYTVTITYNDLCTATATMRIIVDNNLQPYVPNAFSPNGDGNNDALMIYGEGIKTVEFKIFNRWGEKVFETNSQYSGWDGTYKGVMQSPGVYSYSVKITYLDDVEVNRKGSITLIR